ncbi:FKBP-type peptidyl-prolyl cis-trans isomerase, partial [candidate division TA06 bacterium]|nr:FKBP-type peptidyl-prolyl cis-trans isomerase [candidate division TA06 bacterium]
MVKLRRLAITKEVEVTLFLKLLPGILLLALLGCKVEEEKAFSEEETVRPSLIEEKAMTTPSEEKTVITSSGLQYVDLVQGTGSAPKPGETVVVHYTGWLENGTKFDSSVDRGDPYEFVLGFGQVIQGWDEGISTMIVGGKRKLIVPPELGYGAKGF